MAWIRLGHRVLESKELEATLSGARGPGGPALRPSQGGPWEGRSAPTGLRQRIRPRRPGRRRGSVPSRTSQGRAHLSTQYDEECRVQLREGGIDAAFFWMPLGDFDDLACLRVATEPLVVAVAERNRLARLAEVPAEQVAAEPLVWFARHWSPGSWDTIIASVFLRHGYSPRVVVEEVSQEGMVRGVLAATGVTIVTATTARQLSVEGVVYRSFVEPVPTVDVGLAWRADDTSPLLKALVEITQHVAETSPE